LIKNKREKKKKEKAKIAENEQKRVPKIFRRAAERERESGKR